MENMGWPADVRMAFADMSERQRAVFFEILASGETPRCAVMFSTKQTPSCKTDTSISSRLGKEDDEEMMAALVAKARKWDPNFNPTGKQYVSGLAAACGGSGHPEAWVDPSNYRGDCQRICEKYGYNSEGTLDYKATVRDEDLAPKPYKVDREVLAERVFREVQADPGLHGKKDLVEMIEDKITPKDLK